MRHMTASNLNADQQHAVGVWLMDNGINPGDVRSMKVLDDPGEYELEIYQRDGDGRRYARPLTPNEAATEWKRVHIAAPLPSLLMS